MNFIGHIIETYLPYIVSILELIGIFVVIVSTVQCFWEYIQNTFMHRKLNLQFHLANGLATALEFKMAAEILNTVLIRELSELLTLGAVILLRALLSILIHFEMKTTNSKE